MLACVQLVARPSICDRTLLSATHKLSQESRVMLLSACASCRSLGLVLLECVTGRYPFDAHGGPMELIIHASTSPPPLL